MSIESRITELTAYIKEARASCDHGMKYNRAYDAVMDAANKRSCDMSADEMSEVATKARAMCRDARCRKCGKPPTPERTYDSGVLMSEWFYCGVCSPKYKDYQQELAELLRHMDYLAALDERLTRDVPPKYRGFTFDSYSPVDAAQADVVEKLRRWAGDETLQQKHPLFYLSGPVGVGKTGLAVAAFKEYGNNVAIPTLFSEVEFLDRWQRTHAPDHDGESAAELLDAARGPRLLVWDDLGKAKLTEAWAKMVFQIMSYRDDHCLPTLITSNYEPHGLAVRVGEPVADRVTSQVVLRLEGTSRRGLIQ